MHRLRIFIDEGLAIAGTHDAGAQRMRPEDTWTIPLHIIMWTTIIVGLIMAMAVVMMH